MASLKRFSAFRTWLLGCAALLIGVAIAYAQESKDKPEGAPSATESAPAPKEAYKPVSEIEMKLARPDSGWTLVSWEDTEFGQRELRNMLRTQPMMITLGRKGDEVTVMKRVVKYKRSRTVDHNTARELGQESWKMTDDEGNTRALTLYWYTKKYHCLRPVPAEARVPVDVLQETRYEPKVVPVADECVQQWDGQQWCSGEEG